MKRVWLLLLISITSASAEAPKIEIPSTPPVETAPPVQATVSAGPISMSDKDPMDPNWLLYQNRIVKMYVRVMSAWTMMEFKESEESGTVSFTLSRSPLVTFAVVRAPMEGAFDSYVSIEALTPLYPTIQNRSQKTFAGRKGIMIRGILEDGRKDESHFSTDGKSLYRVSFSSPYEGSLTAEKQFSELKKTFRWLN